MFTRNLCRRFSTGKTVTIKLPTCDVYKFDKSLIPTEATTNKEELAKYIKEMTIMRRMEINSDNLYKNKQIFGFCHLYDGQEATALGLEEAITFEDPLITAYRDHCQAYLRGISVFEIIAEMLGKDGGSSKGKGGSMHYYRAKNNFYGGNGIVGAQIAVGTGLAFALKYQKPNNKNIAVAMYGDGAANQGQLFEASNMAALWKLPVVYFLENNRYAMGTSIERHSNDTEFHKRLGNVPGLTVDGLNIFHLREVMKMCKRWCPTNGPITLNVNTYRYHGHSMSDPGLSYRTREEVQQTRKTKDCILYVKQIALDNKLLTEAEIEQIENEAKDFADKETERAVAAPIIPLSVLTEDIYDPSTKGKCCV